MAKKHVFMSPTLGRLSVKELKTQIQKFVEEKPDKFYKLVIGTDSHLKVANGHSECDYVTAIIIHRENGGAKFFWSKEKVKGKVVLRDKIYAETMRSLDIATNIIPDLVNDLDDTLYDMEIHIDVGPKGKTREMIKEVVGMVSGSGFTAKVKPYSWGASSVADRYT